MGKIIVEKYSTIEQLMAVLKSREGKNNVGMRGADSSTSGTKKFTGTASYEEALSLLKNGWTEPLEEIKAEFNKASRVNENTTASRTRVSSGVVGYAPIVPNAILGLPNSMVRSDKVPQKVKAVTVVYNIQVDCNWSTQSLQKCGVAVLKLINRLELNGYRVKLSLETFAAEKNDDQNRVIVDLKDWRQPLDLKKICFPVANPSMMRRIGFRWLETVPNMDNRSFASGYGRPCCSENNYLSDRDKAREAKIIGDNEYFLSAYMVKENKHDVDAIMEQAGMTSLK